MHNRLPVHFMVPDGVHNIRLDAALAQCFPDIGVRARRRLWRWCKIEVNGRRRTPGFFVGGGDSISIIGETDEVKESTSQTENYLDQPCLKNNNHSANIRILSLDQNFVIFFKPSGLHTAAISGGKEESLESLLPYLWSDLVKKHSGFFSVSSKRMPLPTLLTRLDKQTSGIVVASFSLQAAERFRHWEYKGEVKKVYFSIVRGRVEKPLRIKNTLLVKNRAVTALLEETESNSTRWTYVVPLGLHNAKEVRANGVLWDTKFFLENEIDIYLSANNHDNNSTFVRVEISRGARHQIRAHLAGAGYPLIGDGVYGDENNQGFFLHHAAIYSPEFSAQTLPDWLHY